MFDAEKNMYEEPEMVTKEHVDLAIAEYRRRERWGLSLASAGAIGLAVGCMLVVVAWRWL